MKNLIALLFLGLAACGVETSDEPNSQEASPVSMQKSYAAPDSLELNTVNPTVTCDRIWDCERCLGNRNRNVLVEYCDDGTQRRISTGPCGEPCF